MAAIDAFRGELERSIAEVEAGVAKGERGSDDELTVAEEIVFAIDRARWPRMMTAIYAWDCFVGETIGSEFDGGPMEALRAERPDLLTNGYSVDGFTIFAKELLGLTQREAAAAWAKEQWSDVREGVTYYKDELDPVTGKPPPW